MKRFLCLILTVITFMLIFSSCTPKESYSNITSPGTRAYFYRKDEDGRRYLDFEIIQVQGQTAVERAKEIVKAVKKPTSSGAYVALPEYVNVTSIKEKGSGVIIDFSESYKYLDADQRLLAMVAMCRSLLSDKDIMYIAVTCQGEPQAPFYSGYMNKSSFIFDDKIYMK